jgi:peptidoglycan hydrolase CwlO-like protein
MRLTQRIVVGAAAAASVLGGTGAALAADRSPEGVTDAVAEPEASSVVLDAQAAAKKRLWVSFAGKHDQIDRLMERLARAEDGLAAARREQQAAAAAAAVAAAAPTAAAPAPAPAPVAAAPSQPPTTDTSTGASGGGNGDDEDDDDDGGEHDD